MLRFLQRSSCFYKVLTKEEASHRHNIIKNESIEYSFHVNLNPGKQYNGLMQMKFDFVNPSSLQDSYLDFQGKHVHQFYINGQQVKNINYNRQTGKILLPKSLLNEKDNYISINYGCQYDMDGSGCVSFTDVDTKQYLYTQFEPFMANRVFPMFDQPDLKAKMKLAISYLQQWQTAISNEDIQFETKMNSFDRSAFQIHSKFMKPKLPERYNLIREKSLQQYYNSIPTTHKLTSFKQSSLLPSYLYCFVVGPYKKFVCQNTYKNIPMNLYCIESLQPYLVKLRPYIEEMTNKSFEYFESYFRHPYSFSKYDQVFAHEYKWGAMQNAGIVTLNDLYLFKDKVSNERMLSFGNTIVHELAHHWFGNLVTMKWWDDLWLNQSFAQYISHFCLEKIKKDFKTLDFESAMLSFYIRKGWGYNEDEQITTHPITGEVKNTHVAESIFDGITYSKGAAVMKQLMYLIGQQNFSKALGEYFSKYAFKNTELDDLLNIIQKYFPNMQKWKQMWLQKAGGNVLSCTWKQGSSQIAIHQNFVRPEHQTLRIHKINIAYITKQGKIHSQQVMIKDKQNIFEIPKNISPSAVLLNYNDLTFCKIEIDPVSFEFFSENLHLIKDTLFRAMVWRTLYEMVRDGRMSTSQYSKFLRKNMKKEVSDTIIEEQLGYLHICLLQYTPFVNRSEQFSQVYKFLKEYFAQISPEHTNRITILKDKLISFAYSQSQKRELYEWSMNDNFVGISSSNSKNLTISERWGAVLKVFSSKSIQKQQKQNLFSKQQQLDSSDTMLKRKLTCDIMIEQDPSKLTQIYEKLLRMENIKGTTNYLFTLRGLNSFIHRDFIRGTLQKFYYRDLKNMLEQTSDSIDLKEDYKEEFMSSMDPITDDSVADLLQKRSYFEQIKPKNDKLRVLLLKKIDQLKRRQRAYACYQQGI